MAVDFETKGKQQGDVRYVNAGVRHAVEENFEDLHHGLGLLALAEILQDQESVYQSLQTNAQGYPTEASSSNSTHNHNPGQSSGEGNPSESMNVDSQFASDEALARKLQEFENSVVGTSLTESTGTTEAGKTPAESSVANSESNSTNTPDEKSGQDNVDPDNMTYEQLQSLGEAIGSESRGLPDELISYLLSSKYKTGFFSRKGKHEECVICKSTYKKGDKLITLPCKHYYHSKCISHWLKINRACPVCNEEVFG